MVKVGSPLQVVGIGGSKDAIRPCFRPAGAVALIAGRFSGFTAAEVLSMAVTAVTLRVSKGAGVGHPFLINRMAAYLP